MARRKPGTRPPIPLMHFKSSQFDRYPGAELMPGYRLIQLLGRGGFGEVWRCEAPGGLQKAVKFVCGGGEQFRQELAAFEEVKGIRHPYLLMLERVELINGELVMVMELADCQIYDRFKACQAKGLSGIPRDELLGYLEEAAEALDMMSKRYGLQHLDVKPENLFLVSDHMKVGDYGLVRRRVPRKDSAEQSHGFTPRYSAPEVLNGWIDTRSDQYSLALVYFELLTGRFPYKEQSVEQVMSQHLNAAPDLSALPRRDRSAVGKALAKDPAERFDTCLAFVRAVRNSSNDDFIGEDALAEDILEITPAPESALNTSTLPNRGPRPVNPEPPTSQTPSPVGPPGPLRRKADRKANPRQESEPPPEKKFDPVVTLDHLHGLTGETAERTSLTPQEFVAELLTAAQQQAPLFHELSMYPEESLTCSFLCTLPAALVPFKLRLVAERWGFALNADDPKRFVMRKEVRVKPPRPEPRPGGPEVVVYRPLPSSAEYLVIGSWYGAAEPETIQKAQDELATMMEQLRCELQNLEDRRRYPRYAFEAPILIFPHYSDGVVDQPIPGMCRDISQGGVRFVASKPVRTERAYLEFKGVEPVARAALLVKIGRASYEPGGSGAMTVARFRI